MRRLNITDMDLQTRIHHKLKKYPYFNTLKDLLNTIKQILKSFNIRLWEVFNYDGFFVL